MLPFDGLPSHGVCWMASSSHGRRGNRPWMLAVRQALLAAAAAMLAGCSLLHDQLGPDRVSIRGIQPRVEELNFAGVAAAQTNLIRALKEQSALDDVVLGYDDPKWSLVLRAGLQLVDGRCDQYLDALFRFNREQRAARQDLSAATAATASIMGLTGAPGKAIAVVATALGLASTLFDSSVNSVLFQIEPSALRNVVIQGRQAYIEGLVKRTDNLRAIRTRPDMMIALQGYLTQCSPAAIEANINNAANGSPFAVTLPSFPSGTSDAAISTGTPSVGLLGRPFALSSNTLQPSRPAIQGAFPARNPTLPGSERLTNADVLAIQAALGLPRSGDLGQRNGAASRAIAEFQAAMRMRGAFPSEEPGTLTGPRTRETLLSTAPMPPGFRTPFERFFLTVGEDTRNPAGAPASAYTVLDPDRMLDLRDRLGLPTTLPAGADLWDGVRPALEAFRASSGLAVENPAARQSLDSVLYARIRNPPPR